VGEPLKLGLSLTLTVPVALLLSDSVRLGLKDSVGDTDDVTVGDAVTLQVIVMLGLSDLLPLIVVDIEVESVAVEESDPLCEG
jgi:hypothetical protein